jgi:hypothetical protein
VVTNRARRSASPKAQLVTFAVGKPIGSGYRPPWAKREAQPSCRWAFLTIHGHAIKVTVAVDEAETLTPADGTKIRLIML